jgi:hypothetical protein
MGKAANPVNVGIQVKAYCKEYGEYAERINSKDSTRREVLQQSPSGKIATLHRIHEHQACMNKEEEHAERAQ